MNDDSASTLAGTPRNSIWFSNNIVSWDSENDPQNPRNFSRSKKIKATLLTSLVTMGASFASSSFSPTFRQVSARFNISNEVAILSLSLYVLGFAFGPLLWAPLSELYGRKISILPPYFISAIFLIAVATAENTQTLMLCRFFAGIFAAAPLSNAAAILADLCRSALGSSSPPISECLRSRFTPKCMSLEDDHDRALAVVLYVVAVLGGPTLGPLVGSAITQSYLGWRWTEYITAIFMFAILIIALIFLPETYTPVLLERKAKNLRFVTNNWALHAKSEEKELTTKIFMHKNLMSPITMLTSEPIIFLIALYVSFVYGLLYLLFEAIPIEFEEVRGWTPVQASLVFLAILVGVVISGFIQAAYQPIYWKRLDQAHDKGLKNDPEARLPPMMIGGALFAAGLFWFGGGSGVNKSASISITGAACIGAGSVLIFQNAVNYFVDAFTVHAASAQAANTLFRSLAGAGFPLFATPMFHNLGVNWASYLLGFIAVALIPIPVLFYVFGKKLRGMSKYNPDGKPKADEEKKENRKSRTPSTTNV